jgi:hypothetical protein
MKTILFGTFGAERFWEDENLARLPRPGGVASALNLSLDELLSPLCDADDVLCTRFEMPPSLREYHQAVGLAYQAQRCLSPGGPEPLCELLASDANRPWLRAAASKGYRLRPYAVLPSTFPLFREYDDPTRLPDLASVRRVNSKAWSHDLRARLGHPLGCLARGWTDVERRGREMLKRGAFLAKEPHGVSGGGSLVIETSSRLDRILKHLRQEEEQGRSACLVLEPYLEKAFDFSAQIHVEPKGRWELVALLGMRNRGNVFYASHPLTPEQQSWLEQSDYAAFAGRVAEALAAEGYFGPAGIDAMVLVDGSVVPLLEINARVTIGLINHHLDGRFRSCSRRSYLTSVRVRPHEGGSFPELLNGLREGRMLYDPARNPDGVVPLTVNTMGELGKIFVSLPYFHLADVDGKVAALERQLVALGWSPGA